MIFATLPNDDQNNNNTRKDVYSRDSNETLLTAITRTRAKKMNPNAVRAKSIGIASSYIAQRKMFLPTLTLRGDH